MFDEIWENVEKWFPKEECPGLGSRNAIMSKVTKAPSSSHEIDVVAQDGATYIITTDDIQIYLHLNTHHPTHEHPFPPSSFPAARITGSGYNTCITYYGDMKEEVWEKIRILAYGKEYETMKQASTTHD